MVLILFTMAFVIGPAIFLVLARYDGRLWPLALSASFLVLGSLMLRTDINLTLSAAPVPILASLVMMWIAWILVLVLVIRAVRQSFPSRRARRWSRALGAMPTTIPWFGFATAQMMVE